MSMQSLCALLVGAVLLPGWSPAAMASHGETSQAANMHRLPDQVDLAGGGILQRTKHELWATISTSGLDPNSAYTVWWVIFNNPGACADPCGPDDLGNEAVGATVYHGTGFVTGPDGLANVSLHTSDTGIPSGADVLLPGGLKRGNGFGAEVHLVLRGHGPPVIGSVADQISSFAGECGPAPDFPLCLDQQAIAFLPVGNGH